MKAFFAAMVVAVALSLATAHGAPAQSYEEGIVEAACLVLDEIMAIPVAAIPASLLADAQGIAIVPNLIKGGFVVGVRHGRGVLVVRDETGRWKAPVFVTLTGGSVGWQIGLQATDIVLVFKTRSSVLNLMRGKFTLGVDAAAAAGPVGREASAGTDLTMKAEIYSYSRSRGLFAGLALDGSALQIDPRANSAYYGSALAPLNQSGTPIDLPASANKLLAKVAQYTGTTVSSTAPAPFGAPARGQSATDAQVIRRQLADASRQLDVLLDEAWKRYLALPPETYIEGQEPPVASLSQALVRFDNVAKTPHYLALAQRPEFRTTHELLRKYVNIQTQRAATLGLPPPPR